VLPTPLTTTLTATTIAATTIARSDRGLNGHTLTVPAHKPVDQNPKPGFVRMVRALSRGLIVACLALTAMQALAASGYASTADEASVQGLEEINGEGKVLSVSEQDSFFKVKVLVDGKVRVLKIPKRESGSQAPKE